MDIPSKPGPASAASPAVPRSTTEEILKDLKDFPAELKEAITKDGTITSQEKAGLNQLQAKGSPPDPKQINPDLTGMKA
jgi:hypothetical protein